MSVWRTKSIEQSIAEGYRTLEFPDFTEGKWKERKPVFALGDRY